MSRQIKSILTIVFGLAMLAAASSIAVGQTDNGALKKDDVVKTIQFMKQTNSSDQEIAQVISNAGVDFKPTENDEQELRRAGASDAVIAAVKESYRGPETPPQNEPLPLTENGTKPPKAKPPKENKPEQAKTTERAEPDRDQQANQTEQNETQPRNNERPAQPHTGKQDNGTFKVGDRVEVDTFMRGDYAGADQYATWRPGKVIRIENPQDRLAFYVVQIDEDGSEMRIRFRTRDIRWIRAPQPGPQ